MDLFDVSGGTKKISWKSQGNLKEIPGKSQGVPRETPGYIFEHFLFRGKPNLSFGPFGLFVKLLAAIARDRFYGSC
jgi:hypothetical protein